MQPFEHRFRQPQFGIDRAGCHEPNGLSQIVFRKANRVGQRGGFNPVGLGICNQCERSRDARRDELLVGFHKKGTGKPSITWPEAVDEALCFGWIDGQAKSRDEGSYLQRFTPRGARSIWSVRNRTYVDRLRSEGRMREAGERAVAAAVPPLFSSASVVVVTAPAAVELPVNL